MAVVLFTETHLVPTYSKTVPNTTHKNKKKGVNKKFSRLYLGI